MKDNIVWIKEAGTNNIYCCELEKAVLGIHDITYDVNCIIGSFTNLIIPRHRTFKNPVPCTIFKTERILYNGSYYPGLRETSWGMACYDIEKL